MADTGQQLELRAGDRVEHALRAAVKDEAVAIPPHEQHRGEDPVKLERAPKLGQQAMSGVEVMGDP